MARTWMAGALLLCLLASCAIPRGGQPVLPAAQPWAHELSELQADPAVTWGRLESGLRYALLANPMPPGRTSLRLYIGAGSLSERAGQSGLAHFLEHMAFKGSQRMPGGELVHYLERLGMAFGPDTNAYTGYDRTVYQLELPGSDPQMLRDGLMVLRDTLDGLLLPADEIERERSVVLSEKRTRDSASYRAQAARLAFLLPGSRVVARPVIGTDEVLRTVNRAQFLEFYQRNYVPANALLVAVGEFELQGLQEMLRGVFATAPSRPAPVPPAPGQLAERALEAHLHYEPNSPVTLSLNSVLPLIPEADSLQRGLQELYRYMGNTLVSRRLQQRSREPGAPIVDGRLVSTDMLDFARINTLYVVPSEGKWREALALAEQELRRALQFGFRPAEVDEVRASLRNALEQASQGAATRSSRMLADQLLESVADGRVFTHPSADLAMAGPALAAVDGDTLLQVLRENWPASQGLMFASGDLDLPRPEQALLSALQVSRAQAVQPPEPEPLPDFAYRDFGRPGQVLWRSRDEVLGVTQVGFANGVRVNLKPTDFELGRVRVGLRVGTGRLAAPAQWPGLDLFMQMTFRAGGLAGHSEEELNRILAGRNTSLGVSVADDALVITGATTPGDLLLQLQLMSAYLVSPGYREEAQQQFARQLPLLYQSLQHTAGGVLSAHAGELLYEDDPRFSVPPQSVMAGRSFDELRQWLSPQLESSYLELTVVGDVEIEPVLEQVAATFGALPARDPAKQVPPQAAQAHFPADRSLRELRYEPSSPKAMVAVYWPADDGFDRRRARQIGLLAQVLENRMVQRIRVEQGQAYSPSVGSLASQVFPGYGYFSVAFDVSPDKAREVLEEARRVARELAEQGVSEDELLRARTPLVARFRQASSNNGFWLQNLMDLQERPERAARIANLVPDLESIQAQELSELAREYFAPGRALPVLVLPREGGT